MRAVSRESGQAMKLISVTDPKGTMCSLGRGGRPYRVFLYNTVFLMHAKLVIAILSDTAKTWIAVKKFSVKILEHSVNPLLFYVATKYGKRDFVEEM